jgi:hypothetical protein
VADPFHGVATTPCGALAGRSGVSVVLEADQFELPKSPVFDIPQPLYADTLTTYDVPSVSTGVDIFMDIAAVLESTESTIPFDPVMFGK